MKQIVKQSKKFYLKTKYIVPIFLLIIILSIAFDPAKYSKIAFKGLEVWVKVLVPALLPFFILTKLFASGDFITDFTKMLANPVKKIYKCPPESAYIFFMSIITGYPVGAKLVSDFYSNGRISKTEAIKTLSFCSNSGPMFILGSVAIGMFANKGMGVIIYISHILGSLINGLIYRNIKDKGTKPHLITTQISNNTIGFTESINSSISSILLIGGVICFTFVIIEVITSSPFFKGLISIIAYIGTPTEILTAIFSGIFEITKGCLMLSSIPLSSEISTHIATFIISFGGISTLLQAIAFTKDIIPTKLIVLQKITHALCATFVCFILLIISPI